MAIKKSFNSTGAYSNKEYLKCQKKQTDTTEIFIKYLEKIKKYIKLKGPILDLGSGSGYFLKACQKLKLKAIGLEGD